MSPKRFVMNAPYFDLVKSVFPNTNIVTDRFHIVRQITRALNQLRIKTMNSFQKMAPDKVSMIETILETTPEACL